MSKIQIIGGHGKVALQLAQILTKEGHQVTSLFRNKDHTGDVAKTGASPKVFDIEQATESDFAEQLRGADVVYFSAGAGGGNPARTYAVDRDATIRSIKASEKVKVKRFIVVSYFGAGPKHGVDPSSSFYAYAEAKAAADTFLRSSGLDWTVLKPPTLTLEPATGKIKIISSEKREDTFRASRANVAEVAAAVLRYPNTIKKDIPFVDGDTPIDEALAHLQ